MATVSNVLIRTKFKTLLAMGWIRLQVVP